MSGGGSCVLVLVLVAGPLDVTATAIIGPGVHDADQTTVSTHVADDHPATVTEYARVF